MKEKDGVGQGDREDSPITSEKKKRKVQPEQGDVRSRTYSHRLHYRWSQIEADRCGVSVGSAGRPLPKPSRTLELTNPCREYDVWPCASSETPAEQARFSMCADVYKTIDYNTFKKNGALKLTEVEVYFLSSKMTRKSSSDWAVVYLGVGNGERFRYLRDQYFPDLAVIAFDPLDDFYTGNRDDVHKSSKLWNSDGTKFTFHVRCFEAEKDMPQIREQTEGRRLLLISDIRGCALINDGRGFDKDKDNDVQWDAIQQLRPVCSLLKFVVPNPREQFYNYAPGVILKQIFANYGTLEGRLMVDGVPEHRQRYNGWEIYQKMTFHQEHLRGQVYETARRHDSAKCLCCCFDCTILWDTFSTYASQNNMDANEVLNNVVKYHIYSPPNDPWWTERPADPRQRWYDVEQSLRRGYLTEAIAALEADGVEDEETIDWAEIAGVIWKEQPSLSNRLKSSLPRPTSRAALVEVLGSLSEPFTLVRTGLNSLLEE